MNIKSQLYDSEYESYNISRPGYPQSIYKFVSSIRKFDEQSNILEIGAGTGIASQEIFDYWHPNLTLIEPGIHFFALLKERFNTEKVKIINASFEDYRTETRFDAIFSASSFHWIDNHCKYVKSYQLLRDNGLLVVYSHHFRLKRTELSKKIESLYRGYNIPVEFNIERQLRNIRNLRTEIQNNSLFSSVAHKIITYSKTYNAYEYINLLKTFIHHHNNKSGLNNQVRSLIEENDNKIEIEILLNLEIAQKKC